MPRIVLPLSAYREIGAFCSKEQTRYYLNGVCLETAGVVVATDGHMLAARRFAPDEFASVDAGAADWIIPLDSKIAKAKAKGLKDWPHWLVVDRPDPTSRAVTLYAVAGGDAGEALQIPREKILSMAPAELIDGTFPDWRRVTPRGGRDESRPVYQHLAEAVARWEQDPGSDEKALDRAREALGSVADYSLARPALSPVLLARVCEAFPSISAPLTLHPGPTDADPALVEIGGRGDVVVVLMPMRRVSDPAYSAPDWALPAPRPTAPALRAAE